jgi:CubicO group peptidase (beta-lactamase class C family)
VSDAQPGQGGRLAAALAETAGNKVPGLSAALVRGDRIVWAGAAGLADRAAASPARTSTIYLWFSMTKIPTATAVVQLAERARLDLDEPVSRYVPEFPRPAGRAPVTIRHLLSHSSGLPNPIPVRWVHPASSPARISANSLFGSSGALAS